MSLNIELLRKAINLTKQDRQIMRTPLEEDILQDRFVANFVAESESLEGNYCTPADVLNSYRDLVLGR